MSTFALVKKTLKYCFLILLVGILLVGVGIWALFFPHQSLKVITVVFSFVFLVAGFLEIIFSLFNKEELSNWGWGLILGILKLVVGILLLMNPTLSALTLAFYLGFLLLFRSIGSLVLAFNLKEYQVLEWGDALGLGLIGLIISLVLILNPYFTTTMVIIFSAISLIISGLISIYSSIKLRQLQKLATKISDDFFSRYEDLRKELKDIFSGR